MSHFDRGWRYGRGMALAGVSALLVACSGMPSTPEKQDVAISTPCNDWFDRLDRAVAEAGVTDVQEHRVAGHPWLRTSRFTAALAQDRTMADAIFVSTVVPQMRALDRAARAAEISNLPKAAFASWGLSRYEVLQQTERCAAASMHKTPPARGSVVVPDDYRAALRWWGVYPLTKHIFTAGVQRELHRLQADFNEPVTLAPGARLVRYVAEATPSPPIDAEMALLDQHQPVFEKEVLTDDDLAGALVWSAPQARPVVQPTRPTLYRTIGHTRYRGRTLTQLVYTLWFGARPPDGPFDLLAGHLDGLVWRVTLGPEGRPLVYDTMHPCGCYHYFFPTPRALPLPAPKDEPEWMFSPQALPHVTTQDRVVLRVAPRTHYLKKVVVMNSQAHFVDAAQTMPLRAVSQEQLRTLPVVFALDGSTNGEALTRSAYGPDGLVPGTERAERWFFWPMGITSAGQMRQWGRHATAFVGKRHFDDAYLFERRFEFVLGD